MNFTQAIASGFKNYVGFSGRACRSEYWYWVLAMFILGIVTTVIDIFVFSEGVFRPITSIMQLAVFLPSLAIAIRRLHDLDRTGWWFLIIVHGYRRHPAAVLVLRERHGGTEPVRRRSARRQAEHSTAPAIRAGQRAEQVARAASARLPLSHDCDEAAPLSTGAGGPIRSLPPGVRRVGMKRREFLSLAGGAAAGAVLSPAVVRAQQTDYPARTVRIVIGFGAGGGTDTVARIVAQKLTDMLGGTFLVENKPGGSGRLAPDFVAKSTPDGYTLLGAAPAR